jgi:hypothetical protein
MTDKCQAALCGGCAWWRREPRCPPCRLACRIDGIRPAILVSLYLAWHTQWCLLLAHHSGFPTCALHARSRGGTRVLCRRGCMPHDSWWLRGSTLHSFDYSLRKESSLASLLPSSRERYISSTHPSRQGRGLERRPATPCRAEPQCAMSLYREVAPKPPLDQYGPNDWCWDPPPIPERRQLPTETKGCFENLYKWHLKTWLKIQIQILSDRQVQIEWFKILHITNLNIYPMPLIPYFYDHPIILHN